MPYISDEEYRAWAESRGETSAKPYASVQLMIPEEKKRLIMESPDDTKITVGISLHAKQWREAIEIMSRRMSKGDRKCRSLSGLFWYMTDRTYQVMKNAESAKAKKPKEGKAGASDEKEEEGGIDNLLFAGDGE